MALLDKSQMGRLALVAATGQHLFAWIVLVLLKTQTATGASSPLKPVNFSATMVSLVCPVSLVGLTTLSLTTATPSFGHVQLRILESGTCIPGQLRIN